MKGRDGRDELTSLTKLGRLAMMMGVEYLEDVWTGLIPITEFKVVDEVLEKVRARKTLEGNLSTNIVCILSVQKHAKAVQKIRFKAF